MRTMYIDVNIIFIMLLCRNFVCYLSTAVFFGSNETVVMLNSPVIG